MSRGRCPWVLTVLAVLFSGGVLHAQSTFREDFEGPAASWSVVSSDAAYRIAAQNRVRQGAYSGEACEQVQLLGNNGSFVYLGHPIRRARVIRELAPSLWLKADRPGLQVFARAVLPRTEDPRTGKPVTTLLPGDRYLQPGQWQPLAVRDVPGLLARQVRVLRSELGPQVDPREAYIDQLLVNIYGGPGLTTVSIDRLEVAGVVEPQPGAHAYLAAAYGQPATQSTFNAPVRQVQLQGALLTVDGRPVLPRIIQHRGEPLDELARLGFNVVQLAEPATAALLAEARRLGIWLIAPPPSVAQLEQAAITPQYDVVIAWSLGSHLTGEDLQRVRALARALRRHDPRAGRPLVADCHSDLRSYSRIADVLILGGSPIGTSLQLSDYPQWLTERTQFARPGTPIWCRIQTDYDPGLTAQWRTFAGAPVSAALDSEQIRFLVYASLAAGARGFVFDSHRPLNTSDATTAERRLALEIANLDLRLIEPWATGGSTRTSAHASDPNVSGAMIQTERARLLLPLSAYPDDQFVPNRPPAGPLAFVVPGVPESNNAYALTPASLPPLRHQRVTGGIRVTQERTDSSSMLLMTSDAHVISSLTREIAQTRRRAAELKRQQAMQQFAAVEQVHRRLTPGTVVAVQCDRWLEEARASLAQCQVLWAASDFSGVYREARRTLGALGRVQRARWNESVATWPAKITSPFSVTYATLPYHAQFADRLRQSRVLPSRLPAGDMERLDEMLAAGWKHVEHPVPGVSTKVELSVSEPHSGRTALRLAVWPHEAEQAVTAVETAPVWITTPPVTLEAGQLVRIRGWVRVPQPITGSRDGLLIVDSLSGPALAQRVRETSGWQEFTLYRFAPESGPLIVTFALTGLGEVYLDDLSIEPIERAARGAAAQAQRRLAPRLPQR